MSLNNISLPSQLIADLYHHSLVGDTATAVPQKTPVSFLGKNKKNILILVNQPDVPFLPDAELSFLTKVLTACQLALIDVAIVNWNKSANQDAAALQDQFHSKYAIFFDVNPSVLDLPAGAPLYSVQRRDDFSFVAAPALNEIEKTREAKNDLWVALKQLFGI